MPPKNFKCKRCGNCCLNLTEAYQTSVSDEDIEMWEDEGRSDILAWVCSMRLGGGRYIHDIWIHPKTDADVWRCPWLRKLPNQNKYKCRIQNLKPGHCRAYPHSKEHAEETGCKAFE